MQKELDVNYIQSIIQSILNKVHTNDEKKRIVVKLSGSKPELQFACPVCGDSQKNSREKRMHLYLNNLYSKCYNEEECSCSFICLCKKFGIDLNPAKKMEIYDHMDSTYKYKPKDDYAITLMDKLIKLEDFLHYCNESKRSLLTNVIPIEYGSKQYYYLKNRYISDFDNIYQGDLFMTKTWTEQVVVILNRSGDNLLGAELRNLKEEKTKRIYKVLDFEYLYKRVYPDKEIDEMEMITYKKISHLINILNVNFESKITLFEGYFDSMFFPNSIGMVGKSTSIDILVNNELDIRFAFDNDKAGKTKSIELIDKGYSVFLWDKLFHDLKIKNPKEKDINKLVEKYKNPNIYTDMKLENYFSRDSFDKIWIQNT